MLLIRFAIDFSKAMKWWLAAPFCLLVIAALVVTVTTAFGAGPAAAAGGQRVLERTMLLAAIPLGFLASSLDCTGLSAQGCSPFCTFVKLVLVPLAAVFCVAYLITRRAAWLTAIIVMSFVPLAPHCVCYNLGNAWWIDRIGASPLCYVWGFVVSIIAVGALRSGTHFRQALTVCLAIIAGASGFFVSHHYFHFPW